MSESAEPERRSQRRGIYLLPNLMTTGAMFAGFYAIIAAMNGRFVAAAVAIVAAGIMDGLDGRIARMTGTTSDFGKEYDSLSDLVSFGLAPALVLYQWSFQALLGTPVLGKLGWLAAFFYAVATALRLARFNARAGVQDKRYFQGLPSPAAAGLIASVVWLGADWGFNEAFRYVVGLALAIGAGGMMVSNFSYYSFKDLDLKGRVPFRAALVVVGVFMLIAIAPPEVLSVLAISFALSGPGLWVFRWRSRVRPAADETADPKDEDRDA